MARVPRLAASTGPPGCAFGLGFGSGLVSYQDPQLLSYIGADLRQSLVPEHGGAASSKAGCNSTAAHCPSAKVDVSLGTVERPPSARLCSCNNDISALPGARYYASTAATPRSTHLMTAQEFKPSRLPRLYEPTITLYDGSQLPQIGAGTWKHSDEVAPKAIYTSLQLGYRLLDGACGMSLVCADMQCVDQLMDTQTTATRGPAA